VERSGCEIQLEAVLLKIGGGGAWGPVLFSKRRIKALALVGLVCGPLDERADLIGLAGRGYRAAVGSVKPGRSESGGTGETAPKVLAFDAVGVAFLLEADSGSVRSLTTVSRSRPLSTDLTDLILARGVVSELGV
jgi:hypothetical protein